MFVQACVRAPTAPWLSGLFSPTLLFFPVLAPISYDQDSLTEERCDHLPVAERQRETRHLPKVEQRLEPAVGDGRQVLTAVEVSQFSQKNPSPSDHLVCGLFNKNNLLAP